MRGYVPPFVLCTIVIVIDAGAFVVNQLCRGRVIVLCVEI